MVAIQLEDLLAVFRNAIGVPSRELLDAASLSPETQKLLTEVRKIEPASLAKNLTIETRAENDTLEVTLLGPLNTVEIPNTTDQLVTILKDRLTAWATAEAAALVPAIELRIATLSLQRDLLANRIDTINAVEKPPLLNALVEKEAELEAQLLHERAMINVLESIPPTQFFSLRTVSLSPPSRIDPSWKLNFVIAGVLGLLIGVMLAFFFLNERH